MVEAYSQELVSRITRLSRRQLEYWDETDVIRPSVAEREGRGSPRIYSFQDLIKLKVAARMRRKLRPAQMRELMRQLEARGFQDPFVNVTFVETVGGNQVAYIDPEFGPLSAHGRDVGTVVETFGLPLRDLRSGLEKRVAATMARKPGKIAKMRNIQGSEPVVVGTRVPAAKIAALADAGWDTPRILQAFPHLTPTDIDAAVQFQRRREARSAQSEYGFERFLIDEDVDVEVGKLLADHHDVRYVVDILGSGSKDPVIRRYLRALLKRDWLVLVTGDNDFAKRCAQEGSHLPCVWLHGLKDQELVRATALLPVIEAESVLLGERFFMEIRAGSYMVKR